MPASRSFLQHVIESAPHSSEHISCGSDGDHAPGCEVVGAAGQSAALVAAMDQLPAEQTFLFEPVERCIKRATRNSAAGVLLEFTTDGNPVGIGAQSQHGKEHELFEFAQIDRLRRHGVYYVFKST